MKSKLLKMISFSLAVVLLTACARDISSDVYSGPGVGEACETFAGTISNVRVVTVRNTDRPEGTGVGAIAGGVGGGIAGSAIGKGAGSTVSTAGGALAGIIGGALLERKATSQKGLEYIVQLDNGDLVTIVQGKCPALAKGQRVFVMVGCSGRSRVIPQS